MKLPPDKFWRALSKDEKVMLADELNITKVYLSSVMNSHFRCSTDLAVRIEEKTKGAISRKVLRPDVNFKALEEAEK